MPSKNQSLFRTQTKGLLLRTWHYERRQYCNVFCTIILPPFLLILLSILGRTIKAREVQTFPFQQRPKGAFVPRPFDPAECFKVATIANDSEALQRCSDDPFQPDYTVPVFAPQQFRTLMGSRNAQDRSPTANTGILAGLSLSPFVYPLALPGANTISEDGQSFFDTQTSYDGIFLHNYFDGDKNNSLYLTFVAAAKFAGIDTPYATRTEPFETDQSFKANFFDSWFKGGVVPLYSTGLTFQRLSQNDQGDLDIAITVFFNESTTPNCSIACPLLSNVVRTHNAIYQTLNPGKTAMAYLRRMPLIDVSVDLGIIRLVISIVIGFTTHFWLPSFLRFLVFERETRIRAMMSMMGLGRYRYWFGTYVGFYLQYTISILLMLILGAASKILFYSLNTPVSYLILFFLWGHTLVAFAMAIAPFFTNPQTAQVVGWLYIIVLNIVGGPYLGRRLADQETSEGTWFAIMILPSFAYLRSVYYAGALNSGGKGVVIGSEVFNGTELGMCRGDGPFCKSYAFLIVQWALLMIAALYFDRVLPTAVGNRLHPLFFLGFKRKVKIAEGEDSDNVEKGADVIEEENRAASIVENMEHEPFNGVVLNKLSKTYPGKEPVKALQGLSLVARKNEVLCILAHNGAGKTTAFRTLVGELEATSGNAYVVGKSIMTEMDEVHKMIGVAPQQNVLWDVLTVEEHLYFYGRVKNLFGRTLKESVENSLESVQLDFARKRNVRNLSGGMKRRLSVSIALIGSPDFIVLDECSTGLDILAREKLWEAIEASKEDKAIMLTTHSLEEAETLGDRVAIMSRGQLKCIGKVEELKLRLGKGHHLTVSLPSTKIAALHDAITEIAPGAMVETKLGGNIDYVLPKSFAIPEIFASMERQRDRLEIRDWAINQSTLEDVFLEVTQRAEQKAVQDGVFPVP